MINTMTYRAASFPASLHEVSTSRTGRRFFANALVLVAMVKKEVIFPRLRFDGNLADSNIILQRKSLNELLNIFTTMKACKVFILMILLLISCSMDVIAQTSYYYYKGNRIPLTVNNDKVCVNIPKDKRDLSKELLRDINVLDKIKDEDFDISIIQQSDFKKLSASNSWEKEAKSVLLSSCYITKEDKEVFLTPYLNVRLKREQDNDLLLLYAEKYGLRIVKQDSFMPLWYILSVTQETGKNALEIANTLWETGKFAASVPDLSSKNIILSSKSIINCCNDPEFHKQWGLSNSDFPGIDISVCNAWQYSTGKNVKIAILDMAIKKNHRDLYDNIISELSYNTENNSPYYYDEDNHATHCAGIAAAIRNNSTDIAGVAPEAKIIPIYNSLDTAATNIHSKLANGIIRAYEHGADIISNSWGLPTHNPVIEDAILRAFRDGRNGKGCIVVFATGNNGDSIISYPANCNDTILAVGSIKRTGEKATSSQYGMGLDLVAPGDSIFSTVVDHNVGYMSGTSMACPHVAGVAALVLQRNPELTVTQVNSIICRNTKKISGVSFNETKADGSWNKQYGYGLVDAYSSVINTPEIVYIQNDTITGTRTISADKIYVGRDVTDRKEQGKVILGQGNITLNAKSVIIKNSTTVPLGTKLRIENQ